MRNCNLNKLILMKKLFRFLFFTAIIGLSWFNSDLAIAQQGGFGGPGGGPGGGQRPKMDPEKMAARVTATMKERLKLDENQEAGVQALNLERFISLKDAYKKASDAGDMSVMQVDAKNAEEKFELGLKAVLKEAQWKEYELFKKEQKERREQRMRQRMDNMAD
jgi:hypothetical protein